MMDKTAVCYITDEGYLLPSIISATTFRRFIPDPDVGVFIFTIDVEDEKNRQVREAVKDKNITLLPMSSVLYADIDVSKFKKSHVPLATVGRFFLNEILPPEYTKIVYIDGDTWVANDPTVLINTPVPEGKLAAADDTLLLQQHNNFGKFGNITRKYFRSLGVNKKSGYLNAGVFTVSRKTWAVLSKEAYAYLKKNTEQCPHHDQSALNAIIGDKRLKLSCVWNFQTPYKYLGIERAIQPRIYHFTKQFKPWMGRVIPWDNLYEDYKALVDEYAELNLPLSSCSEEAIAHYNKRAALKKKLGDSLILSYLLRHFTGYNTYARKVWL